MVDEPSFEDEERPEGDKLPDEIPDEALPDLGGMPEREARSDGTAEVKEVKVVGVYEHQDAATAQPAAFVLLRDNQGRSVLIWIGRPEAFAISVALEGATADRPMTHDLMKNLVIKLGGDIERIVIDDLWHDTYYAKIHIAMNGNVVEIDSRPSDAIALGLRAKAPIYMAETVLEQAAVYEE
ncbi:MAG: bifunctional nuclease family protein [Armatimonadetes bacterium]|nr:bifunctional nuclease family protein [Armatimonadota bacterium]